MFRKHGVFFSHQQGRFSEDVFAKNNVSGSKSFTYLLHYSCSYEAHTIVCIQLRYVASLLHDALNLVCKHMYLYVLPTLSGPKDM